jgi:three-Cys-motif partner protein
MQSARTVFALERASEPSRHAGRVVVTSKGLRLDEVGHWSEIKLEIVQKYAAAYSRILASKTFIRGHVYVDGFAGAGTHLAKDTGRQISGSPLNALNIDPPFTELHFVDMDGSRVSALQQLAAGDSRARIHHGNCNEVLLRDVFPRCLFADYRRALCLLDPYGLNVNWEILATAGGMKSVEVFYNFMIMDANMNVFMRDPGKVTKTQAKRMDAVWGDASWRDAAYHKTNDLFGALEEKASNEDIAEAFRKRLQDSAGFAYVPKPIPMRNSKGATVYFLYFASPDPTGGKIVTQIFDKYRDAGRV